MTDKQRIAALEAALTETIGLYRQHVEKLERMRHSRGGPTAKACREIYEQAVSLLSKDMQE